MSKKQVKFGINPLLSGPSLQERSQYNVPYREIPLSDIDVDPNQPRRVFNEESLAELAESIKQYGVLNPILVRPLDGGTWRVIAGERRLRASQLAGKLSIPAIVEGGDSNDEDILPIQLVENIQRQDLLPMERALAVGQLRERFSWSVREIAGRLGVSKAFVQRSLEILSLPDDLKAALVSGAAESKVLMLAALPDIRMRKSLLERLDQLSREQLRAEIEGSSDKEGEKVYHRGTDGRAKSKSEISVEDQRILEDLQRGLGTKIAISRSKTQPDRGRINIEFYSNQDLFEIYRRLTNSD